MNMISTGAFQTEMDASSKQPTLAEKFAAVWEKKNAKAARAGGVSLMALSLAACGSDSTTTTATATTTTTATDTTTTTTTTVVADPFTLTPLTDIASSTQAANGSLASTFRFTSGNDTVNGMSATMAAADTLIDGSATDADVLNITATGATAVTSVNIETVNFTATSGAPNLDASAITGATNINVSGTVASTVDNQTGTVNLVDYTRILTVDDTNYNGTAAAGNADSLSMTVSGATHGTTAATQSGITLVSNNASVLETLNIESKGSAANDFTLVGGTNVTLSTVNITGSADVSVRMANVDITGLTFNATAATGSTTMVLDRNTLGATASNVNLFTGIDNLTVIDSAAPAVGGDTGSLSGLTVGQKITFADDFNSSVLAFQGATGSADSASIVLDNATAVTDTDMAQINAQNIETLSIDSSGFATSSSTTAENLIDDLVGDATTITVTGDTSIDIDLNIDAATAGARAVAVDASANTAFVNIEAAAGAGSTAALTVGYNITGTAGNDTLSLNGTGGTLTGGAGNDTLTGSALNDTISTGAGTDLIEATTGTDTVTFGAGTDSITFGESDVTGVAQVSTLTPTGFDTGLITINIDGLAYTTAFRTNIASSIDDVISNHAADILADTGMTATDGTTAVVLTGNADGTAYDVTFNFDDNNVGTAGTVTASTAAVAVVTVATSITGFTTGSGGDVIQFDVSEMNAVTGIDNLQDSTNVVADGDAAVITDYSGTAVTMAATANVIKVGYANTINAAADVLTLIDAANITTAAAISTANGGDGIIMTFYDADGGNMIVGHLSTTDSAAAIDDNTAFEEIASLTMTSTEYTALTADNFAFIA
jgi:hypothetical protein